LLEKAEEKVFDLGHRKTINHNIGKYNAAVERGLIKFENLEQSKKKAHVIKVACDGEPGQVSS
jgi:L-lactate dehydrogenase complex protein LldF